MTRLEMKKKFFDGILLMTIFLVLIGIISAQVLGGYKPAEIDADDVVAAAEKAVELQGEKQTDAQLELTSIEKAEKQSAAGINYRLCLIVAIDGEDQDVKTIIHAGPDGEFELKSWTPAACRENKEMVKTLDLKELSGVFDFEIE